MRQPADGDRRRQPLPGEHRPDGDAANLGFRVPGHLDAKVYLRNDYEAPGDDDKQQNYAQVDGRVNRPLSLARRLNDGTRPTAPARPCRRRSSTLRNAPGLQRQGRLRRAELPRARRAQEGQGRPVAAGPRREVFTCAARATGSRSRRSSRCACIVPTKTEAQVAGRRPEHGPASDGDTTSGNAARTVDAVAGPFGGSNDADLRGFTQSTAAAETSARGRARRSCRRPACA